MGLNESDIWNEDAVVRDAAVRGFLADELFWSSTRWDSDPHGAGWLSTQYKQTPSAEARELLVSSVLKCLEDPSPQVRAASGYFFSGSSVRDDGSIFSLMRENAELFKQTPYPYSAEYNDLLAVLAVVLTRNLTSPVNARVLGFLRDEVDRDPANLVLVSAMALPDRDQEWMLSQAPRLLARRPESLNSYIVAIGSWTNIEDFLSQNKAVLPRAVLREQLAVALYSEEEADKMLAKLGL